MDMTSQTIYQTAEQREAKAVLKPSLTDLCILGMLSNTNRGYGMGGVLVVVGHLTGTILPPVENKAWIEYGPTQEHQIERVTISPDHAWYLHEQGWLEVSERLYAATRYILTTEGWKWFAAFDKWRDKTNLDK